MATVSRISIHVWPFTTVISNVMERGCRLKVLMSMLVDTNIKSKPMVGSTCHVNYTVIKIYCYFTHAISTPLPLFTLAYHRRDDIPLNDIIKNKIP